MNRYVQLVEIRCAGTELIFCFVACMVLCSGFGTESVVNTGIFQLLQSRVYTVKVFSVFNTASPVSRLGVHKGS